MKKKYVIGILCLFLMLFLIYQKSIQNKTLICTYQSKNDLYQIETEYRIYHKKDVVTYLDAKEKIISEDQNLLKEYNNSLKMIYEKYNSLDYYNNQIRKNDNSITSITSINYKKINIKEWLKLDNSNRNILNHNKVSFHKLVKRYKDNEASCHYK